MDTQILEDIADATNLPADEGYRLSPQQHRLWLLQQVEDGTTLRAQCVLLINGKLDTAILKAAVDTVVRRHSILRTCFRFAPELKMIEVGDDCVCWNADQDLSAEEPERQKIELERLIGEFSRQPFDSESGPLVRLSLITTSSFEHRLLIALSALCADGVTLRVLAAEISRAYAACLRNEELSETSMQYAVISEWLNAFLESDESEVGREYWRNRNISGTPIIRHPFERKSTESGSFDPQVLSIDIRRDILDRLGALSSATPLAECLLACWQILLWRHTGQSDVVVAREFDGRTESDLETVIGPLAKFLPVRNNIQANQPFSEFLKRMYEASQEAESWQEVFAGEPRGPAAYGFAYDEEPEAHHECGLTFRVERSYTCTDYFKLKLVCRREADVLRAEFHYDGRYFDIDGVSYIARQFQTLLASVANNPEEAAGKLSLLSEEERQRQLVEWNDTSTEFPASVGVHRLFESRAAATPLSVALSEDNLQLSYGELNQRANQLARYLRRLGVGLEDRVGICLPRSMEMVVAMLGVLKAGAAYVPLDPQYPLERLALMLEDAQAVAILTSEEQANSLPSQWAQVVMVDSDREEIEKESGADISAAELEHREVVGDGLAYIIYTSGSTGTPKGVAVTHRGITRLVRETSYASFGADEVFLQLASASFDASTFEIWGALLNGARLAIMPDGQASLAEIGAALRQYQVTTLWLTAGLFHQMVDEQLEALLGLRQLLAGGDVLAVLQVRRFLEAAGGKSRLINGYGPTENTTFTCCHVMAEPRANWSSVPIGRPISNTQVYVLDEELQPAPVGVSGELCIGGAGLAREYWRRPEQTAERFVPNPFGPEAGGRLYRTGDLVRYLSDGNIEFIGRRDEQVKLRGFRIELGEIESVLGAHTSVRECVVVVIGEADHKRLVAYVVGAEAVDGSVLRAYLKDSLPEYMVPSAFVTLEEIPLTPNGKVDRKALPEPEWVAEASSGFVAARTLVEEVLTGIWEQVLDVERVGVHDNFFELGGHSLLATQVISRVRESFSVELPLRVIFESPTIAESAAIVEVAMRTDGAASEAEPPPLKPVSREELLPLSFAQLRLWFFDQLEPGNSFYNIFTALRLTGCLDEVALEKTLSEILRRHETLRTTFSMVEGRPVQVISPAATVQIPIVDLRGLAESEAQLLVQEHAREEAQRPFDLAGGLMIRACLLRLADEEHVLLFTMHHIASDGWSIGVLVREVVTLYDAYSNSKPSPLPELALQYADFAQWQREWLQDTVLDSQLSYWKKQLADSQQSVLELPTDRPRPLVQTFRGATHSWSLSKTLTEQLEALSRREGVTLYMTLLAAYVTLLYRYSGQDDILIGTPIANRNRAETEPLIGFFVNTLVLRTNVSGNPTFRELLKQVREVSLEGYLHQDLPFEKLVDELQPERSLSHHPLFQVMFIFNNAPMPELKLPGLTMSGMDFHSGISKFDTTLIMMNSESGLRGVWEYNLDLFDTATAERMVGHFNAILESIVADTESQPLDDITVVNKEEQQQLLVEWNDTTRPYSRESCVHELFEARAAKDQNALAVAFKGESLTYGELNRRANQLARHLRGLGVGPEVMVGILTERSTAWLVGLLGILKAGGAYVCLDPTLPRERLAFMMEDAGARVLVTQQKFIGDDIETNLKVVRLDADWEEIAEQSDQNLGRHATAESAAYVVYTSGSTGRPKGVVTNHGSILNLISWHWSTFRVTANDRASQLASMGFDAAVWELWPYLTAGASIHILEDETRFSPLKVKEFFEASRISIGWLPPSLAEGVLISENLENLSLRVLLTGSDRLLLHPPQSAPFPFVNAYGPTEATVIVTSGTIAPLTNETGAPHIGRPLDNTQIYILNRRLQPCPVGVAGELYMGGDQLARGYLNRPELTAEKFVPSPFSEVPGARLYKSGDLAKYQANGNIEFVGRIDHQVKIRGFRIELGEVEATLLQHPKLEAAIVIAREDRPSDKRLVGYVVARPDVTIAGGELRDFLRERLPEYMIPTAFVELSSLPLTRNGKVDRRALPVPDYALAADHADFVPPRTSLEESLAEMWGRLLGIELVGVNQSFFESGGHSLLATQLVSHVREAFEVELPLRDFFESPTIAGLAAAIESARNTQVDWQPIKIETLPRSEQSLDDLLAELDQLSDEDAQSMLAVATRPAG